MNQFPSRRAFLASSLGAAATAPLLPAAVAQAGAARAAAPPAAKKKLLILGGTAFLGPAIVESALAHGHEVTLFNRGKTHSNIVPELEKLSGHRNTRNRI